MKLSIIIPCLNEEKNIPLVGEKIYKKLKNKIEYEVIWVNDGSIDETDQAIKKLNQKDPRQKGISLMNRTGQSGALMAGIRAAKGKYIATLDGDNQNDPEFIKMIKKLEKENLDAVIGWRQNRWQKKLIRKIPSLAANKLIKTAFRGLNIHDAGCPVKVVKAKIMKDIQLYGELHRFLSYIIGMYGARMGEIKVTHRKREHGVSKYGLSRTIKVIFDIINLKFLFMKRTTPIILFGPLAVALGGIGTLSLLYLIIAKIFININVSGSPWFLISLISYTMAIQFISIGLLGELIIRSYYNSGDRKTYLIRELIGFAKKK